MVVRAGIILMALDGHGDAVIARRVGVSERTVYEWTKRFARKPKLSTLRDRPRSGRPPTIAVEARCEVIRLACERPEAPPNTPKASFRDVWTYESLRTRRTWTRRCRRTRRKLRSAASDW